MFYIKEKQKLNICSEIEIKVELCHNYRFTVRKNNAKKQFKWSTLLCVMVISKLFQ